MKTLTVRLPERLVAHLEAESQKRGVSKSEIVRERLQPVAQSAESEFKLVADLIGSVRGLPVDLSSRKKRYLQDTGYGEKHPR
ncbi:MAG: ribbon-helix-helix protein, CopG family [Candidatus Eremiobacteraeota bacterium]|nr:ribbon-helix-helix protein, CopG family [Candidatus Eremiobacteraeota bacterium]MBV8531023.1 ribbon-helix-helix protein, CopG family [Candidatus Eremiobacteraeota bacterium]